MSFNNRIVAVLAMVAAGLSGCGSHEPKRTEAAAEPSVRIRAIAVERAEWPSTYEATGTVRARTAATISSKVMGYVGEVRANIGDSVRAGDLLVTLDSRELEAAYRQAEATAAEAASGLAEANNAIAAAEAGRTLARTTFKRMAELFEKRSISNQEYDEATAKLKVAEANYEMAASKRAQVASRIEQTKQALETAQVMRSYSRLTAPFAGTVTEKSVEPGNLATPGAPLLVIEQSGAYRFEASVEESLLQQVRTGQAVQVRIDSLGRTVPARISEIVPSVDPSSRTFTAKAELGAAPLLRSGMFGRMLVATGARSAIAIPAAAVDQHGQVQSVMVVADGSTRRRLITTGQQTGERIEVLSGLAGGERIVFPRVPDLRDGAKVEVQP